jgi:hypothetical protein
MRRSVKFAVAGLFAGAVCAPATGVAQTGTVAGQVTVAGTGAPRAGASLVVAGTTRGALADSAGRFVIGEVPVGQRRLRVRQIGYAESEVPLVIRAGETTFVRIELTSSATTLGAIRTEARGPDRVAFLARPSVATTSISARAVEAVPRAMTESISERMSWAESCGFIGK